MRDSVDADLVSKIVGVAAISVGINYLITKLLAGQKKAQIKQLQQQLQTTKRHIKQKMLYQSRSFIEGDRRQHHDDDSQNWKKFKLTKQQVQGNDLLEQLRMMTLMECQVQKINNLIVDLEKSDFKPIKCPLVADKPKLEKDQPFILPDSLVKPGTFVIRNCVIKDGKSYEYEKKFLRAGPRATQYFDTNNVVADVVCLGSICPGTNTVIRQITLILKETYKIKQVYGIKNSFEGYYKNQHVKLTPQLVQTIHHFGGCYLGTCKSAFQPDKIIDNLQERGVNQLYMIGNTHTLLSAKYLYKRIRQKKLEIALCVILKAINKDAPIFDQCFGFQTAIETIQSFTEAGYVAASSYKNCVTLIEVPGANSGFLAAQASRASRSVNICLVPQFPYDLYGKNGLLNSIIDRVKQKGSCKILFSEGIRKSARDFTFQEQQRISKQYQNKQLSAYFGYFLKNKVQQALKKSNLTPYNVVLFNPSESIRSASANSLDTKLCCQLAHASIQGLMCGYTYFASGHIAYKNTMVPISEMLSEHYSTKLTPQNQNWQRVLTMTGQPSFLNDENRFVEDDIDDDQ